MIEIYLSLIFLAIACAILSLFYSKLWMGTSLILVICLFFLVSFQGYPADTKLPDKITVYGLTSTEVWAGTEDNPIPRSYIFQVPEEWLEERDRRKGHPFEVEKKEAIERTGNQDRDMEDSENLYYDWKIIPLERIEK